MGLSFTDEELMQLSTCDLRTLFETKEISAEEHRQLRNRRRRLQNRKYARKCARKKQTEVELLTNEVDEEQLQIQLLRRQLSRIKLSTQRMQHQILRIANFHEDCLRAGTGSVNDGDHLSTERVAATTVRMLHQDGRQAGMAVFQSPASTCVRPVVTASSEPTPLSSSLFPADTTPSNRPVPPVLSKPLPSNYQHIRLRPGVNGQCSVSGGSVMPAQLAAGPGLPSSQNLPAHFGPMRLVRPVGCGWASNYHGVSEF